jgi:aspartate/glutamate/glutamine transport system substrate-binding protein
MRAKRLAIVLVAVAIVGGSCADDNGGTDGAQSVVDRIKERGTMTFGVKYDVPQFGFKNPATDKVEGFDVDMAKEVAKDLGVTARFVEAVSKDRIPFVQAGTVDAVFSTMTITDERKKQIDFSDVYYVAEQSFLTRKGEEITVDTAAGKKVCTAKGSTSELNLPAIQPDVEMVLQDGYSQCAQLIRNRQADAMSTDDVILLGLLKGNEDTFQVSEDTFSTEPYGAGIKKGSALTAEVSKTVDRVKTDGTWARLYRKWITPVTGDNPPAPPSNDVKFAIEGLETPVPAPSPSPTAKP